MYTTQDMVAGLERSGITPLVPVPNQPPAEKKELTLEEELAMTVTEVLM